MILNPFLNNDAFSTANLVASINILPNNYGRLREMNLFPAQGVYNKQIIIEEKNGVLNILNTMPWGSDGQKLNSGGRTARSFTIPHIPAEDSIMPEDYAGIRAFGSENQNVALAELVNDRMQNGKDKMSITLEYLRIGALKGIIYDADGTVIYDLYKEFLIKPKAIDFVFGTSTTNIQQKCLQVKRHIEQNLKGEIMRGDPHVLCHPDFFDALVGHAVVKDAYSRWQDGAALRTDMRKGFPFSGLVFEEYGGTTFNAGGTVKDFFTSKYGIAFPLGTANTFKTFLAPADFLETVNTKGKEFYAKMKERDFGRGMDIHMQSNPLPMCMRPGVLVTVFSST